ncbi:MAG: DUF58 domain-containing protein [Syntrophothermus sp.]
MSISTSAVTPERVLQRLDWQVIRRLDGLLQGNYRSLFYGFGVDFADLREYQAEDDIRYIDWNVTARMQTPYVRQYTEDREVSAWFILDMSPSVDFGTLKPEAEKRNVLIDFVAVMSRVLTRHGNRVGAMIFGNGLQKMVPARGGRIQVLRLINEMLRQPRLSNVPVTDLRMMLRGALNTIKRRSLIFVVSDFISTPGWEAPLSLLNQRHEVIAIRLWDPAELDLPDVGVMILEDAETGEQLYVDTRDKKFRTTFQSAMQEREAKLKQSFKQAGVDLLSLSTGDDMVHSIVRFAKQREKLRRMR